MPATASGTYLFQHKKRSANWYLKLQYPPRIAAILGMKTLEKSLGTSNRLEAEALAAPEIAKYKTLLFLNQTYEDPTRRGASFGFTFDVPPGESVERDGMRWSARPNGKTIIRYDLKTEKEIDEIPNAPVANLVLYPTASQERDVLKWQKPKPKNPDSDRDKAIIQYWGRVKSPKPRLDDVRAAMNALDTFRTLFPGVGLEDATYEQACELCIHYQRDKNNAHTSAQSKVRWLSTALRFAGEKIVPNVKRNPFVGATPVWVPPPGQAMKEQVPVTELDDNEMARFIAFIPKMKPPHQLLAMLVLTTGMRPAEACSIASEQIIDGTRCITVGKKIKKSDPKLRQMAMRTFPLPKAVVPFLPIEHRERILGPVFEDAPVENGEAFRNYMRGISRDMGRYLDAIGLERRGTKFYSLRHRAITTLAEKGCPNTVAYQIVGHQNVTDNPEDAIYSEMHGRYINRRRAYPVDQLGKWVGRIYEDYHLPEAPA